MQIITISGIAIISCVVIVMLKKTNPEFSIVLSLSAGAVILYIILSQITPVVGRIQNLLSFSDGISDYSSILFKSLGICFLTQFSSDSCKDAGESALASKVELAGKIMIVITSLPLFENIADLALNLIK